MDSSEIIIIKLSEVLSSMSKETFSLGEAADYLKITTESVIYYSKRQKELSHINLGGTLVFKKKHLDDFLEKKTKSAFLV